ncbi:MAG: nucleoside deaminase [Devosia sp.]|nr:nucleoside deaminase [Devosia sp.]
MNDTDLMHLVRAVDLAEAALASDNDPFGSVLVGVDGRVLFEDHNWTSTGDETRHPEIDIAKWAAANMSVSERAAATVYTSGEHCPMCAAAHAWVGLGRIIYAGSSAQLSVWLSEVGAPPPPVATLPISTIAPGLPVEGPELSLSARLRDLHHRRAARKAGR